MAGFEVTPDELRSVAKRVVEVADEAHRNCEQLSGAQEALGGAAQGFQLMSAAQECEQSWQRGVEGLATTLAVAGDKLDINAEKYARADADNAGQFRADEGPR